MRDFIKKNQILQNTAKRRPLQNLVLPVTNTVTIQFLVASLASRSQNVNNDIVD